VLAVPKTIPVFIIATVVNEERIVAVAAESSARV